VLITPRRHLGFVDADGAHGLKNATVSQGYKAVTVTGTYFDKNNSERSYSVLIEENKWNADFEATYTDSNKQVVTLPTPLMLMSSIA
jgi:hypothetical protein